MHRKMFSLLLLLTSSAALAANQGMKSCENNSTFNIGAGIYDITGPAAEQRMMGYAMLNQSTSGLYSRLWARAFVLESPCNGKRVVFVNADLGQLFQAVKQQVVRRLKEKYGNLYDERNVLITATHQHSGPGGYSTYTLYNLTILGFSEKNFNAIVNGIVTAIDRAQMNMAPATIKMAKGQLSGVSFNRSPQSYALNPESERALYRRDVDTEMTLIRFDSLEGKPIGMINWFPVHGVSMNNKNHLINGDNKGYAEYLFERDFNSDYGPHAFVAAFAQANAGDVSPNEYGHEGGQGMEGMKAVERAGRPQYELARNLFESASEVIRGGIDFRHVFVEMDKVNIDPRYTDGQMRMTCPPAIGVSMLAGTADGEGVGRQGLSCANISSVIPAFLCENLTTSCQGVKPIALQLGNKKPYPWVPLILPFQEFKLGQLVIVAAPFELTTMSGRRIKTAVQEQLPKVENNHVVLSTLANAYAQYVTTPEEYQLQRYEGASNLFGPWTLSALRQQYAQLTRSLLSGETVDSGPTPPDLLDAQTNFQPGVLWDSTPSNRQFGDVYKNVESSYKPGDSVQAIFWGAHPKNNYRLQNTFLEVQHLENGQWKTVRQDRDWDTEYHWQRSGLANSLVTIVWRMPVDVQPGQYRIVHHGDAKSWWGGKITPYAGYSAVFTVG
ncbi:Neutral ceramidase [Aquicella siphonis]|uniref:Neutral ceramidase n=1 Tax=Aquicella siphonis TaxID=254247 RepID=A0A5E4PJT2_9COXI|nr:neutral/alkaline non-lysosomal ceramidase N-terminal domain-containing protein [Aquicella siphonis]VVC76621.1 Neutral ceramidase [Aquicella siphonis]